MYLKPFFTAWIWKWLMLGQALTLSLQEPCGYVQWKEKGIASAYIVASWLTDPLCTAHQLYRQVLIVDTLYPTASVFERTLRKGFLLLSSFAHYFFSLVTTLPGVELRFIAKSLQNKPYIHFKGNAEERQLTDNYFSLLSWNVCCVTAGYSITDGGVLPWVYRTHQLTNAIREQDADVVCLYEIFDIQTAYLLIDSLKDAYSHFYFHMGPSAIGLSSGLFVASKMQVSDPQFTAFPPDALYGRSKHCKKGFFSFDIQQDGKSIARIFATHLQHSEMPENPVQGEFEARKQEMQIILEQMGQIKNRVCVLTGDLNLEDREFHISEWKEIFDKGIIEGDGCTWGGDQFCAQLVGKGCSPPLNLDHTMVRKDIGTTLTTTFVETGFDPSTFKMDAISDHKGLFSVITFR